MGSNKGGGRKEGAKKVDYKDTLSEVLSMMQKISEIEILKTNSLLGEIDEAMLSLKELSDDIDSYNKKLNPNSKEG